MSGREGCPFRLDGRVAVVAGASRNVGLEIARAFAAAGAGVVMAAREAGRLGARAAEIRDQTGAAVMPVAADVTSVADTDRLVSRVLDAYPQVDVLVNNPYASGNTFGRHVLDVEDEAWDITFRANVLGPFRERGTAVVAGAANLGIATPLGYGQPPTALRDLAVAAERRGLAGIQVGELASTEVFSLVAAMAAATSRVRLETAVISVLTRSPALLAMGAATLAELSSGRFVLGLGAGSPAVAGWHGREFPARPRTAMVQAVSDVRAALAGERLPGWDGFRLAGIEPRSDVRIFMAAMNPRMLRAAAGIADGVVVNFCPPAQAAQMAPALRSARAAAGRTSPFEFVVNVWAQAGTDIELAERRLRWEIAPYLAVPTYRAAAVAIAGEDAVDLAGTAWRSGGRAAAAPAVPQRLVDELLVHGQVADFARRLAAYGAAGTDTVRLVPLTSLGGGIDAAHDLIDVLGELGSSA